MRNIQQTAIVPYTTEQMFKLVNNIEAYPAFLPWCKEARVTSLSEHQLQATVYMSKGLLKHSFTTKNTLSPYNSIEMELVDGPFSHLEGAWYFKQIGTTKCEISIELEFEFVAGFLSAMLDPLFHSIIVKMVDAFRERAETLYGV